MLYLVLSILRFAYLPIRIQAISSPKKTEYTDLPGGIIFRTFVRQNFKRMQGDGVLHHSSCPSYPTTSCSSKTIPSAGANGKPKQRQTALSTARNSITYDAYYWPDERAASRRNALDVPRRKWHIHGLHPFINHSLKSPTRTLLTSIFSGTGTTRLRDRRLLNHRSVSLTAFRGIRKRVL